MDVLAVAHLLAGLSCYQFARVLRFTLRDRALTAGLLLPLAGCAEVKDILGLNEEQPPPRSRHEPELPGPPPADLGDSSAPPEPLARATRKLRFPGKSGEHMGFDLDKLARLRALAGAVEVPEWSDPGRGVPRVVRDDDLRTAWSCQLGPDRACAIGIHFPRLAAAEVVRIFAAAPDGQPHTQPKRVRVHTDEGWAEAKIANEDGIWHVILGEAVTTRNLSIEFKETHDDAPLHLAEFEVFGRKGNARPPLKLDLTRHVVTFAPPLWRKKSRTYSTGASFIERVDIDGKLERLLPGTALIGRNGDRLLLVERAGWSTCDEHQGSYSLLDTQTRVMVPLGNMAGFPSHVYRHAGGLGFGMGHIDGDDPEVVGVVFDGDHYERNSTNRLDRREPRARLVDWGIDTDPLRRGEAYPLTEPPAGCGPARADALDALEPHLPARASIGDTHKPWFGCSLGARSRLLMSTGGPCGREWRVAVLDMDEGTLVGMESGKDSRSQLRLRRLDPETILVEQWGDQETPRVMQADSDTLARIEGSAGLSLRPPASCRTRCDLEFDDLVAEP